MQLSRPQIMVVVAAAAIRLFIIMTTTDSVAVFRDAPPPAFELGTTTDHGRITADGASAVLLSDRKISME